MNNSLYKMNHVNRRLGGALSCVYCIIQVMNPMCYITDAMGMDGLFSLISRMYIIVSFVAFALYIIPKKIVPSYFGNIILLAMSAMISYLVSSEGISLYKFTILLAGYLALPIYLLVIPEIRFSYILYRWTYLCNVVTSIFFIYAGFFRPEYYLGSNALTMGFFNANQAGIFIVQNVAIMLCCYQYEKSIPRKIFIVAICIIETYFAYLTQSRTSVICIALLLFIILRQKRFIPRKFVKLVFLIPIIMAIAMIYFSSDIRLQGIELFGKPIMSGREKIYLSVLLNMENNWLLGNFSAYQFSNLHNAYLSVFASTGIIGSVLFLSLYYKMICKLWHAHMNSRITQIAFMGILLLFFQGSVEAAGLVSGSMYAGANTAMLFFLNYAGDTE